MSGRRTNVDRDSADWKEFENELSSLRKESEQYQQGSTRLMTAREFEYAAQHDPNSLGNDKAVEIQWAIKAGKHAETYFALLQAVNDKSKLKLTKHDDKIYTAFRGVFPKPGDDTQGRKSLDVSKLDIDQMKTEKNKKKWRQLIESMKDLITDFDLGTILRMDASRGYDPDNCEIVPRLQFYAIEIARNREGANDGIVKEEQSRSEL